MSTPTSNIEAGMRDMFFLAEPSAVSLSRHCSEELLRRTNVRSRSCESTALRHSPRDTPPRQIRGASGASLLHTTGGRSSRASGTPDISYSTPTPAAYPRSAGHQETVRSTSTGAIHARRPKHPELVRVLDLDRPGSPRRPEIISNQNARASSPFPGSLHFQQQLQQQQQPQSWAPPAALPQPAMPNAPNGVLGNIRMRCLDKEGPLVHGQHSTGGSNSSAQSAPTANGRSGADGLINRSISPWLGAYGSFAPTAGSVSSGQVPLGHPPVASIQPSHWSDWRPPMETNGDALRNAPLSRGHLVSR